MKILLASAHPYLPQIFGGAQSSTHELAVEFRKAGHEVAVLAGLTGRGWRGLSGRVRLKLEGRGYVTDRRMGYPVHRAWVPARVAARVAADTGADVVLCQSGHPVALTRALEGGAARRFIYLRNVEVEDLGGDIGALRGVGYIANSRFTAQRFAELFGIASTVIYPMIIPENYRTETSRATVTYINPHPLKGLDTALALAERCPDIPFVFVRAWTLSPEGEADLRRRVAPLRNVRLRHGTRDMKSVYGDARIVLVPSRWEEAFGRVAAEAQCSGIPVIGTRCGGLPEAIGPGGAVIDPGAPIETWVGALRALWDDPAQYDRVRAAALAHAARPEMCKQAQIESLLRILATDPRDTGPVPEAASEAELGTAPQTAPGTMPEAAAETVPETAPETAPEAVPATMLETAPETAAEAPAAEEPRVLRQAATLE